jgi:hypothetical protein
MHPAPVDSYPGTGWDGMAGLAGPSFIPNDVVIPTLDDVPDGADPVSADGGSDGYNPGNYTKTILAYLDTNALHWDFFINTNNWAGPITGDAKDDPDAHQDILDILTNHNPANHTVYHAHMGLDPSSPEPGAMTPQCCDCSTAGMDTCDAEMSGVETVIAKMSNGGRPHLTRFRPPYGEPYQTMAQPALGKIEPVVAKYAVWVGWNILSSDADGDPGAPTSTAQCSTR